MNILAFDTSHAVISVALSCGGIVHAVHETRQEKQGTHLLPAISYLLQQANITLADLDCLALGTGPGSFTGLRIGCSAAQAISLAHNLAVIPISSLQLLAQTAFKQYGGTRFLVAVDAKQNQCYCGQYQLDPISECMQRVGEETMSVDNIADNRAVIVPASDSHTLFAVGSAWPLLKQRLLNYFGVDEHNIVYLPECSPMASAIFDLVRIADEHDQQVDVTALSPHYLNDMPFSVPF